jgi:hypothetical protein
MLEQVTHPQRNENQSAWNVLTEAHARTKWSVAVFAYIRRPQPAAQIPGRAPRSIYQPLILRQT